MRFIKSRWKCLLSLCPYLEKLKEKSIKCLRVDCDVKACMCACKDVACGICCLNVMALHVATDHTEDSANTYEHAGRVSKIIQAVLPSFNT